MAKFCLTTTWKIPATLTACWYTLLDVCAWSDWWEYVYSVTELQQGDHSGVNSIHHFHWKTALPYQLQFKLHTTKIIPYQLICFEAEGDLQGKGYCKLKKQKNYTHIQFFWHVQTNKPWMTFVAYIAYPVFEWNHRCVMHAGEQNFIHRLISR